MRQLAKWHREDLAMPFEERSVSPCRGIQFRRQEKDT